MGILKQLPNTITCLNLLSGGLSIIFSFQGNFESALLMIVVAAVFDFLDGFAARLLKAYSEIGKELDSLADVVSFGLAPSLMAFNYMHHVLSVCFYISAIPLVIAAFSALRLAKFNLDDRQTSGFLGMPVPANALFIGSMIATAYIYPQLGHNALAANIYVIPALSVALSFLLVSEVPMFSMKFKSLCWKDNRERFTFLIITIPAAVILICFRIHWTGIVFSVFSLYLVWNLVSHLFGKLVSK